MEYIYKILNEYNIEGEIVETKGYGNGHINDTFFVSYKNGDDIDKYILQRINDHVFKKPEQVMENIMGVTEYLRKIIEKNGGDPERETLNVIKTKDGKGYCVSADGSYWRMFPFITDTVSLELPKSEEDFYQSAVAFGTFQKMLADYPAESLHETIIDFHNTPVRYTNLIRAIERNASDRAALVKPEIDFVKARRAFTEILEESYAKGELPKRVTHNDTKLNNVLLDKDTGKPVCVVDLDTIMPGYSVNDFGDSIRFGANTVAEDERDLDKVNLNMAMYEAYAKGFLFACGDSLTEKEIELLPVGAKMMTLECGMRFLTDYIDGDIYFKTDYPEHNLVRARVHFKLVEEMEKNWEEMGQIIKKFLA